MRTSTKEGLRFGDCTYYCILKPRLLGEQELAVP